MLRRIRVLNPYLTSNLSLTTVSLVGSETLDGGEWGHLFNNVFFDYVYVCVSAIGVCIWIQGPSKGRGSESGVELTGGCELSIVGAGNQIQVSWRAVSALSQWAISTALLKSILVGRPS